MCELCTGGELFDAIIAKSKSAAGHYSEHDAASLVKKILSAIDHCHSEHDIVREWIYRRREHDANNYRCLALQTSV